MFRSYRALASERGQGTVEYVALIMLVAVVFAAVATTSVGGVGTSISKRITSQITKQIDSVTNAQPK